MDMQQEALQHKADKSPRNVLKLEHAKDRQWESCRTKRVNSTPAACRPDTRQLVTHRSVLQVVQQAPRGGHQQVDSFDQLLCLCTPVGTAHDQACRVGGGLLPHGAGGRWLTSMSIWTCGTIAWQRGGAGLAPSAAMSRSWLWPCKFSESSGVVLTKDGFCFSSDAEVVCSLRLQHAGHDSTVLLRAAPCSHLARASQGNQHLFWHAGALSRYTVATGCSTATHGSCRRAQVQHAHGLAHQQRLQPSPWVCEKPCMRSGATW